MFLFFFFNSSSEWWWVQWGCREHYHTPVYCSFILGEFLELSCIDFFYTSCKMSELLILIMPFYLTEDLFVVVVVVLNTCKYSWTPAICSSVIMDSPIHFFLYLYRKFCFLKKEHSPNSMQISNTKPPEN